MTTLSHPVRKYVYSPTYEELQWYFDFLNETFSFHLQVPSYNVIVTKMKSSVVVLLPLCVSKSMIK